jgi:cysteine desulfurase/selenocysteine lyase
MIAEEKGAIIEVIPVDERGVLDLNAYRNLLDASVKLVAVNHVSNAIGTINPIAEMIQLAHAHGAKVMIDGAQSIAHLDIDVQALLDEITSLRTELLDANKTLLDLTKK